MPNCLKTMTLAAVLALSGPAPCRAAAPFSHVRFQSAGRAVTMARWSAPAAGRHPAVLLLHGGGGPELIENDPNYRCYPEALAAAGYMVYMPYFWESTRPDVKTTPANLKVWLQTAENALAWIDRQESVQSGRVGAIGLSLGGHLGLMLSARDAGLRAFVDFYGWLNDDEASAVRRMPPMLILHGDSDVLVDIQEAHKLERLFRERRVLFGSHIYTGQNHGFTGDALEDSIQRMVAFLDRHVR